MAAIDRCGICEKPRSSVDLLLPYRKGYICDICVIEVNSQVLAEFAGYEPHDEDVIPLENTDYDEDEEYDGDDDEEEEGEEGLEEEDPEEEDEGAHFMANWGPMRPVDEDTIDHMLRRIQNNIRIERKDLSEELIDPDAVALLPKAVAEQFCLIPLRKEGRELIVAFSDPTDEEALQEVKYFTGMEVSVVTAEPEEIEAAIRKYYGR